MLASNVLHWQQFSGNKWGLYRGQGKGPGYGAAALKAPNLLLIGKGRYLFP